jgi:hypothetical protein
MKWNETWHVKTMHCATLIAALVLVLPALGGARDLKAVDGSIYKNITITKVDVTGIQFSHDDGIAFIDFKNLPEKEQKEFGYDPAKYAAGVQEKAAAEKRRQEAAAQRYAAQQAAMKAIDASNAKNAPLVPINPPAQGLDVGVGTPGFRYGGYQIEGFGISNGLPYRTDGVPVIPYQGGYAVPYQGRYGVPYQGGYVTPPIVRQR